MDAVNTPSSSSSWNVSISENFKFQGKGATLLALLLMALSFVVITAIICKCNRTHRNDAEVGVQADVELAASS
ncbi:hypothetical protein DITRI_Ditri15bG0117800 [Diplodiscus trichospermus]